MSSSNATAGCESLKSAHRFSRTIGPTDANFVMMRVLYVLAIVATIAVMGSIHHWLPAGTKIIFGLTSTMRRFWLSMVFADLLFPLQHFLRLAAMPRHIPDGALQFEDWNFVFLKEGCVFGLAQFLLVYVIGKRLRREGARAGGRVGRDLQQLEWKLLSVTPFHTYGDSRRRRQLIQRGPSHS